jgi:hypothetical protein
LIDVIWPGSSRVLCEVHKGGIVHGRFDCWGELLEAGSRCYKSLAAAGVPREASTGFWAMDSVF